jgi:hypothetical protein
VAGRPSLGRRCPEGLAWLYSRSFKALRLAMGARCG